ncbi:MAG: SCO family protein [Phycisphaerae bacterium]|nr:SCO family protein [Phycisphaerae bacterium]
MTQVESPAAPGRTPQPLPPGFRVVLWLFVPLFMLSVGVLIGIIVATRSGLMQPRGAAPDQASGTFDPLRPDSGLESFRIPAFDLVDQSGQRHSLDLFRGRVTIVGFVFTNCPLACPAMTAQMASLQQALKDTTVRLASISLDPEHDTPAILKAYGENVGADFTRWVFLTQPDAGTKLPPDKVWSRRILVESLKMHVALDSNVEIPLADGSTMVNIVHPTRLFLVGDNGQVLGTYDTKDMTDMRAMQDRARRASVALTIRP